MYKACCLPCLGHCQYHAPSTPFTPSFTRTKLTRLCLTISVSSATAERSLSALRTLKTFRSTMNATRLAHLALLHVPHQDRTVKWTLTICVRRSCSSRPKQCRCAVHYCKFIWWIKLCITHLQRSSCDQRFGLKLQFAYNQNSAILHIKFPNFFGVKPPNPHCGRRRPSPVPTPEHAFRLPQSDPHFQIAYLPRSMPPPMGPPLVLHLIIGSLFMYNISCT